MGHGILTWIKPQEAISLLPCIFQIGLLQRPLTWTARLCHKKLQKVQVFIWQKNVQKLEKNHFLLRQAHFLPKRQKIDYNIALIVFKCINEIASWSTYITKCLKTRDQPLHSLHNGHDYFLLSVPPVSGCSDLKRTERSLSYCGPSVWNCLPYKLRTLTDLSVFKNRLKTIYSDKHVMILTDISHTKSNSSLNLLNCSKLCILWIFMPCPPYCLKHRYSQILYCNMSPLSVSL